MIDLRSDTVTLPTEDMKRAMMEAPLGDDVYGEDPTVIQLEQTLATLLDKEAAIFAPSGTQSNLLALMAHCERGDEYIVGQDAHTYKYEGGGAAVLGSIQPQPLEFCNAGEMDLEKIKSAIKPLDNHFAKTRLICLENTMGGQCLSLDYPQKVRELCHQYGLQMHLDGARLFNAAVKQKVSVGKLAEHFDSVSICLSKGLGAPAGSVLVGSKPLIEKARRWRKVLGGGMRQAGILAAAGLYALEHNIERLSEDHRKAHSLSESLRKLKGLKLYSNSGETNMVFIEIDEAYLAPFENRAKQLGITLPSGNKKRLVFHLNIDEKGFKTIEQCFLDTFK